jgi:hypothetical protein
MVKLSTYAYFFFNFSYSYVYLGKKSKRVTCAHRYSIAKKVRAHNKKTRREARKHPEFKSKYAPQYFHDLIQIFNI